MRAASLSSLTSFTQTTGSMCRNELIHSIAPHARGGQGDTQIGARFVWSNMVLPWLLDSERAASDTADGLDVGVEQVLAGLSD